MEVKSVEKIPSQNYTLLVVPKNNMKSRVNITIGAKLHAGAKAHADRLDMDFSELVSVLLREEILRSEEMGSDELKSELAPAIQQHRMKEVKKSEKKGHSSS